MSRQDPFELVSLVVASDHPVEPPLRPSALKPLQPHLDNSLVRTLGSASAMFGTLTSKSGSTTNPPASMSGPDTSHSKPQELEPSGKHLIFNVAELCGNDLYIGSFDGILQHYIIDPIKNSFDSPLDTLFPTSHANIPTLRGVLAFCIDRIAQSPLSLIVAKKRSICSYLLDDRLTFQKDVPVLNGAQFLTQNGQVICAADALTYKLINLDTGGCIPLFPYEKLQMSPVAVMIGDGEFLLVTASAQGVGLGVFISSTGEPIRVFLYPHVFTLLRNNMLQIHNFTTQDLVQSITFPSDTPAKSISAAQYPLEVKVAGFFENNAVSTAETSDSLPTTSAGTVQVIISFCNEILGLLMIPWEIQVEQHFDAGSIHQAVILADQILGQDQDTPAKRTKLSRIYIRAGIMFVRDANFSSALDCFNRGRINPRALIYLYPDIRPSTYTIIPEGYARKWMVENETIDQIVDRAVSKQYSNIDEPGASSLKTALTLEAQDMLMSYLSNIRTSKLSKTEIKTDIDSTLLKLYAEHNTSAMYDLLAGPNYCDIAQCEAYLASKNRYFAQSLMFKAQEQYTQCLDLWIRISSGEVMDPDFIGIPLIVELLVELNDTNLIWRYAEWVLRRDPVRGVKIFIDRKDELFKVETVLEFLESHATRALKLYIEDLVMSQYNKDPALHTRLGILYIDEIAHIATDTLVLSQETEFLKRKNKLQTYMEFMRCLSDPFAAARLTFVDFVQQSEFADMAVLKNHLDSRLPNMFFEHVSLLIKSGDTFRVLDLLVLKMHDYVAAERYCLQSGQSRVDTMSISRPTDSVLQPKAISMISQLISIYIKTSTNRQHDQRIACTEEVVRLLAMYYEYLDAVQLLTEMPDSWGIAMLSPFIQAASSRNLREQRISLICKALSCGENVQVNHQNLVLDLVFPHSFMSG
ncbi:hypothetical protein BATDEDRAFT_86969 [Batrachochytrium dendrobatidis JAM81]|uniref:Vacuolar sorting protein 39/Transforming growth factor beta receptor-associated domain-containing protein n=1 Tax=Batrachochytrium dendrobatidis (strain JAM81 / FGSC 10211) TaxID=684364 RepID=F4NXV9_BATDJ|nr:uncharacterized protein BATDEDRAFT_86969 [Batrachochytrium dendrobatidis JAM81]EGF82208.1 hypothetical protein BATDEDRAFT_86969 [Batrachochytrium dendrobatidis JAM81]|eukprot:XP_006677668.1 hypothetical protein BATDEDRAFT_86969 [Batrachochytrium dendrobatidis JAM81]